MRVLDHTPGMAIQPSQLNRVTSLIHVARISRGPVAGPRDSKGEAAMPPAPISVLAARRPVADLVYTAVIGTAVASLARHFSDREGTWH